MNKKEFIKKRIDLRNYLLQKIVEKFKVLDPVAIHQFGSGTKGFKDEFSDIDIWVTFRDKDIDRVLKNLSRTFRDIAPIVLNHHSKSWSPVGGSSNSIIHELDSQPFLVDYYISKFSEASLKADSKVLFGDDSLKKGEWRLNSHVNEKIKDSHTLKKDVDLLIDLIFISYKKIVRGQRDDEFIKTLKAVHDSFREKYIDKLQPRRLSLTLRSDYRLLSDLYRISNKRQKRAISKIRRFAHQIEELYSV